MNVYKDETMKEQIIKRMQFDNPWWVSGSIPNDYKSMQHRLYLDTFMPMVADVSTRRGVILMGPRRVGKTVMIFHTIEELIKNDPVPTKFIDYTGLGLIEVTRQKIKKPLHEMLKMQ